jgi:pyruvate formate-lyase activating enzyme-like uncharacterized protein
VPESASLDVSSCPGSIKNEMADLRQQLQSMKKQTMNVMEQAQKYSDREQLALRQAQESLELEKTATSNTARFVQWENYMLDLMTDASEDMAVTFFIVSSLPHFLSLVVYYIAFSLSPVCAFLNTAAEEQRVNLCVDSLLSCQRQQY